MSDRGIVQGSTIRIATGAGVLAVDVIREGGEVVENPTTKLLDAVAFLVSQNDCDACALAAPHPN